MSDTSRRKFLAAAGIGAAGTVGLTGASASAAPATRNTDSAREPVVAFVDHDKDLAARILNAAGGR
jgi:hypothetical protein